MNDTYPTSTIDALAAELRGILGERGVSTELAMREKASIDGAKLSPVIMEQLPLGLADLVAFPATADEIVQAVGAAVRHGVPITPRGKGTGNYGQAIPMPGGLVLDISRAKGILDVGDGFVTAEAGATMIQLETAARAAGQELLMYPSTAQSTIGGFLSGGSCGTGSIEHGVISESGFVVALDVVHAVADPVMIRVEGAEAQSYLHNYGTAGIIVRATVKLEPLREWRAFYASFPAFDGALSIIRELGEVAPTRASSRPTCRCSPRHYRPMRPSLQAGQACAPFWMSRLCPQPPPSSNERADGWKTSGSARRQSSNSA